MLRSISTSLRAALAGVVCTGFAACGTQPRVPSTPPDRFAKMVMPPDQAATAPTDLSRASGRLGEYLAYALAHSPETKVAFEQWRATRFRISRAGRLPEPTVSFGYYLRSVETRVGPQRYNLGVSQTFPWPGKLGAGEDAMREEAQAAALVVDAKVLAVARDVATDYWTLWLIYEEQRLMAEHDATLEALAGAVRGRLQTGNATLADLTQVDLNIARHHDHKGRHEESARRATAALRATLGARAESGLLAANDHPPSGLPQVSDEALMEMSALHPEIEKFSHLAASERHRARQERADRYPRFSMGLRLIGTSEAAAPDVSDTGKDAVVVSAGLSVPLWASSYDDAQRAAEASSRAHLARAEVGRRQSEAMLVAAITNVRDAQRRIELYQATLVPQAETTFQAVLGGYQIGRSTVAAVIIAQRDLIELRLEHARARAERAKAWADLEFVTGRNLEQGETSHDQ